MAWLAPVSRRQTGSRFALKQGADPRMSGVNRLAALAILAMLATLVFHTPQAQAQRGSGWELCNRTSYIINAAIGRPVGQSTVVEGWTKLRPGACEIALEGPLDPGIHFLYGKSSEAHRGGQKNWGGEHRLCIDPTGSFSVENPPSCADYGLEQRRFRPVRIQKRNGWRTTFTETDEFSFDKAEAAGVQRLLIDAGVFSGRIDGLLQRRTRAAISDFLAEHDLPASTRDADLIDLLEQAAIERSLEIGLTLCNRTDHRIWSAIARRRGDTWESRGWWLLEAGGCARAIDEALTQTDYFVLGEMELENGEQRTLARANEPFCVSRAKFAIAGRQDCEESMYRSANFLRVTVEGQDRMVHEFFERDFQRIDESGDG